MFSSPSVARETEREREREHLVDVNKDMIIILR